MDRVLFIQTASKTVRRPTGTASSKVSGPHRIATCLGVALAIVVVSASPSRAAWPGRIVLPSWVAAVRNIEVHGITGTRAEAVRLRAEEVRRQVFATLLGVSAPRPWTVPCEIHVHPTAASFEEAVGGPPAAARGATSIEFAGDAVSLRRIDVMGDGSETMPDALAHELVHVILADRFPLAPPPRWADEGLAVLFDSAEKQAGHDADFDSARRDGMAWSSAHLLSMEEYPDETGRQRVFYGQSASLVRWLIARRDASVFLRFVEDLGIDGPPIALERHYGLASTEALDRDWLAAPAGSDVGLD
jgi:hypothetical protein